MHVCPIENRSSKRIVRFTGLSKASTPTPWAQYGCASRASSASMPGWARLVGWGPIMNSWERIFENVFEMKFELTAYRQ